MAFDAFDGGVLEEDAECFIGEGEEVAQLGGEEGFVGVEDGFAGCLGEFVPGANFQADIAAVDAVADGAAEFFGDGAFVFDGEIGNAAAGIDAVRCDDRVGGTGNNATDAFATMIDGGRISREGESGEDFCEEEPCAKAAMDLNGAFAVPTETRGRGKVALKDGSGIDIITLRSALGGECGVKSAEFFPHQVMVVFIPSVACDFPIWRVLHVPWVVIEGKANDGLAAG